MHFLGPIEVVPSAVAVLNDLFFGTDDAHTTSTQGCMGASAITH